MRIGDLDRGNQRNRNEGAPSSQGAVDAASPTARPGPEGTQPQPLGLQTCPSGTPNAREAPLADVGSAVGRVIVLATVGGFGALLLLYVFSSFVQLVSALQALPRWLSVLGWLALLILGATLLSAILVVMWGIRKLPYNRELQSLRDVRRRRHAIQKNTDHLSCSQVRDHLTSYLEKYSTTAACKAGLLPEETAREIQQAKNRLTMPGRIPHSYKWLEIYQHDFQGKLDAQAAQRVRQCARFVGIKTALSPNPLVDALLVLYWSFRMIHDVCLIYNLRVGRWAAVALLWRVFCSAYVTAKLDELGDQVEESIDAIADHLGNTIPDLLRQALAKVPVRAGTGYANYLLVRRLGMRAIAEVQPLPPELVSKIVGP